MGSLYLDPPPRQASIGAEKETVFASLRAEAGVQLGAQQGVQLGVPLGVAQAQAVPMGAPTVAQAMPMNQAVPMHQPPIGQPLAQEKQEMGVATAVAVPAFV